MSFRLFNYNHRGERLTHSSLSEILADTQPFVLTSLPYEGRSKRHDYVFGELFDAVKPLLRGIQFMDRDNNITYFLKRGEILFEIKQTEITGLWNRDKFGVYANWYETDFSNSELKNEFECNGYFFKDC